MDSLATANTLGLGGGGGGSGGVAASADRSVGSVESLVKQRYERLQAIYDRVTGGKDREGSLRDWGDEDSESDDED